MEDAKKRTQMAVPHSNTPNIKDGDTKYAEPIPIEIIWRSVLVFLFLHVIALYAILLVPRAKLLTLVLCVVTFVTSELGVTVGAHRLWTHRTYKARLALRILLATMQAMAMQNDIFEWSRDHRMHHKYSDTDADPHNAKRGFFFSHMGWLLVRRHPDAVSKVKSLDLEDLYQDPVVTLQRRFFKPFALTMCLIGPSVLPWLLWEESLQVAYCLAVLRYLSSLHATWCVNSVAHIWGMKPYDVTIKPAQNLFVSLATSGEGFHNFHHVFPQDYRASEFGWRINISSMFIDSMAVIGLAYDRKYVTKDMVLKRKRRTGEFKDKL